MTLAEHRFEDIAIGMRAERLVTITDEMVDAFTRITGDMNPLHMDEAYARTTRHGGRVVHGLLTASFMSEIVGMRLPGRRALILEESMRFLLPVRIGDALVITGTVSAVSPATRTITVSIDVMRETECVARGSVVTLVEDI